MAQAQLKIDQGLKGLIAEIKSHVKPQMDKWEVDTVAQILRLKTMLTEDDVRSCKWFNDRWLRNEGKTKEQIAEENKAFYQTLHFKLKPHSVEWYHMIHERWGKGTFQLAKYSNEKQIKEKVAQQAQHKLMKIDFAVEKKVKHIDVCSVETISFKAYAKDGFVEGSWKLTDSFGRTHKFSFNTIYAGGYNIQCLHVRTKYKLKELG